jgi:hypothetical protein
LLFRYARIVNEVEGLKVAVLQDICVDTFDEFLPEALKAGRSPKLPMIKKPEQSKEQ